MPVVKMEDVHYLYSPGTSLETTALQNINLEVYRGEILALAGSTGSGKSTLAMLLNGLLIPSSGRVLINGLDTRLKKQRRELWRQVGLVFQYPEYQFFEESVYKEVAFGPLNMDLSPAETEERVNHSLKRVGLEPQSVKECSPWSLSGGQRRRVALASILANKPEVLVLDEPTAGIDPAGKRQIFKTIKALRDDEGVTVIMITHNMDDIADLADRVLVLHAGNTFAVGTPAEVFANPPGLRSIGLDVPFAAELKHSLNSNGLKLATAKLTVDAVGKEIITYLRDKTHKK
jgi:energy-coupling factor transport system ATP-binding protein